MPPQRGYVSIYVLDMFFNSRMGPTQRNFCNLQSSFAGTVVNASAYSRKLLGRCFVAPAVSQAREQFRKRTVSLVYALIDNYLTLVPVDNART